MLKLLIEKGAKVDAVTQQGDQPIHFAASAGRTETVQWLLKQGAKTDAKTEAGFQPLHAAAGNGHLAVIKALHEAGAALDAKTTFGDTAYDLAMRQAEKETAQWLGEHAPKPLRGAQ